MLKFFQDKYKEYIDVIDDNIIKMNKLRKIS